MRAKFINEFTRGNDPLETLNVGIIKLRELFDNYVLYKLYMYIIMCEENEHEFLHGVRMHNTIEDLKLVKTILPFYKKYMEFSDEIFGIFESDNMAEHISYIYKTTRFKYNYDTTFNTAQTNLIFSEIELPNATQSLIVLI